MNDLTVYEKPMDVQQIRRQVNLVQEVMKEFMKEDEHYGIIPGCKKTSLYKAGAEKLSMVFRMEPRYEVEITNLPNGHREVTVTCTLYSIGSEIRLGSGVGSASTMEAKYRYRDMGRTCPKCGQETIIKGKAEYGGGWLCFTKKGGCGAKFQENDPEIKEQIVGKVEYDNPADFFNTVLKMAKKRAHTDAVLTVTATSDIFAQDIVPEPEDEKAPPAESDPEAEAALKETAIAKFERLWAEKKPSPAQVAHLPKFLAAYKGTPPDEVKAQAAAHFEDFWKIFVEWCAKKGKKTSEKDPHPQAPAEEKISPQGGTGPVEGITPHQLEDLDKVPEDILAEGYKAFGLGADLPLSELDQKTAADLQDWVRAQ